MTIEVRWGAATHQGRVRSSNQDAVLAGPTVFAVADGMGGHAGGEIASAIAIAGLASVDGPMDSAARVVAALDQVNQEVLLRARADTDLRGMGTTIAGIAIGRDDAVTVFNLGDARAYRFRDHELVQVSEDHSVVAEMVRDGSLSPDAARIHPQRSVVTRALGISEKIEPLVAVHPVVPGDRFLLCSDGLFTEIDGAGLASMLDSDEPIERLAQQLVEGAIDHGGRDNVSVVIVDVQSLESVGGLDEDTSPTNPVVVAPSDDPARKGLITGVPSFDPPGSGSLRLVEACDPTEAT